MHKKLLFALMTVVLLAGGLYLYARHRATAAVDQQLARLVTTNVYDTAEYESLNLGVTGDLHLTNVHVSKDAMDVVLQQVYITNLDYSHETPWHLDLEIQGIHFPNGLPDIAAMNNTPMAALLNDIAHNDTVPISMRYNYNYEPEDSHRLVSGVSTVLPEFFTLTLDSESRNVPLETMVALNSGTIAPEQVAATVQQLLSTLAIPQARIMLQDQGILESWIAATAAQRGMTPDALREQLKSQVRNYYLFLPQNAQGIAMQAGTQVAAFLEGGRTLSVAVTPEFEGSLSRLQQEVITAAFTGDFKKIADLLHLEIQAR